MGILSALMVALLTGSGAYLMMRRNAFELLLGLVLFSHGINMFLMAMGGWSQNEKAPLVNAPSAVADYADPVPMALILTAIVISFGVTAFLIVLTARAHEELKTEAIGEAGRTEGEE